jgi:hypothetical protein
LNTTTDPDEWRDIVLAKQDYGKENISLELKLKEYNSGVVYFKQEGVWIFMDQDGFCFEDYSFRKARNGPPKSDRVIFGFIPRGVPAITKREYRCWVQLQRGYTCYRVGYIELDRDNVDRVKGKRAKKLHYFFN